MSSCFTGNTCAFTQFHRGGGGDKFSDFVGFIVTYRGLCGFLDSFFSQLLCTSWN